MEGNLANRKDVNMEKKKTYIVLRQDLDRKPWKLSTETYPRIMSEL
jgi:hypothetical protein